MTDILFQYLITFGWALTGSVSMAIGIAIALKIFDVSTPKIDEWKCIEQGNIAMAIVIAAIIISVGLVISSAI
jgi:uncharacterized membrane protein YjfL (UPF0719 family)